MVRDKVTHMLFGADVVQNATGLADLDVGEIICVDGKGGALLSPAAISALSGDHPFYLVQGTASGTPHKFSPRLCKNLIKAHNGKSYAAPVQQVSYIGDNGSSGDINVSNSTEYTLHVSFIYDKNRYSKRSDIKSYSYTSDATATAAEIQNAFVALLNADANFAEQATAAASTGGGNNGISITGVAQTSSAHDNPEMVTFKITLDQGFDSTTGVDQFGYLYVNGAAKTTSGATSVAPVPGIGTYLNVRAMERNQQGFLGNSNLTKFPVKGFPEYASSTGTYDTYVIDFAEVATTSSFGDDRKREANSQLIVYNNILTTTNDSTTALEAIFEAITGVSVNL